MFLVVIFLKVSGHPAGRLTPGNVRAHIDKLRFLSRPLDPEFPPEEPLQPARAGAQILLLRLKRGRKDECHPVQLLHQLLLRRPQLGPEFLQIILRVKARLPVIPELRQRQPRHRLAKRFSDVPPDGSLIFSLGTTRIRPLEFRQILRRELMPLPEAGAGRAFRLEITLDGSQWVYGFGWHNFGLFSVFTAARLFLVVGGGSFPFVATAGGPLKNDTIRQPR